MTTSARRALQTPGRDPVPREGAGALVAEYFEEHGRMVLAICRLMLRDGNESEDATQQVFLSAHQSLLRSAPPDEPRAWIATIARNECRHRLRTRVAHLQLVSEDGPVGYTEKAYGDRMEVRALVGALAELPQQQRDAIVLREFYGLSNGEAADALGVSQAAIEALVFRARSKLRANLEPIRNAFGATMVPFAIGDSLSATIPGFASGSSSGAASGLGAALGAKLAAAPVVAKIAAATIVTVGAGGLAAAAVEGWAKAPRASAPAPVVDASPTAPAAGQGKELLDHLALRKLQAASGTIDEPGSSRAGERGKNRRNGEDEDAADERADAAEEAADEAADAAGDRADAAEEAADRAADAAGDKADAAEEAADKAADAAEDAADEAADAQSAD